MPTKPKSIRPQWMGESQRGKAFAAQRTREEIDIYKSVYGTVRWRKVRDIVRQRDPVCKMCGKDATHTIDHIKPIRQGGDAWSLDNLQGLCKRCNFEKTIKQGKDK